MGDHSKIEWTDATWNPVTGCTRVSEGCRNCYMARTVPRFGQDPWEVVLHPDRIDQPLKWKRPRKIFVNSLSDLFHEDVPDRFIEQVFGIMGSCERHIFQVLTKRPKRLYDWMQDRHPWGIHQPIVYEKVGWPPKNVWLGVSVENQATADERIPLLLQTPAAVRFVSAEPLLGPVDLTRIDGAVLDPEAKGIHLDALSGGCETETPWHLNWVIVGGESGPGARPMHPDWVRSIRDQCQEAGVPYFFKQWGEYIASGQMTECQKNYMVARSKGKPPMIGNDGADRDGHFYRIGKKAAGALLDGREWREFPQFERGPLGRMPGADRAGRAGGEE